MGRAAADNRSRGKSSSNSKRGNAALWAVQSASIAALRAARLQWETPFFWTVTPPVFFLGKENGGCGFVPRSGTRGSRSLLLALLMLCERHGNNAVSLFLEAHDDHALRGSASLVEVQPNHRLTEHSSMRRAQHCRYFASSLPPSKRHSRLTIVRRGCCQVATRRDSWRSHVHRTYIAQRMQSFKL